jgi:uncharacterized membrane protein
VNAPPQNADGGALVARVAWCLVGVLLLWWGFLLLGASDSFSWLALVVLLSTLMGLVVVAASWLTPTGSPHPLIGWAAVIVALGAFACWSWLLLRLGPPYGTDEIAFDQYAAQLVSHLHNPYQHSMAPSVSMFHVSQYVTTFQLNGSPLTRLSYPDLSFLVYVPFLLLGWTTQLANALNAAAWALSIVLAYWLLPRPVKPMAIIFSSTVIYTGFALGGVSDALYIPLLILAVYRWDRFPELSGWRAWVSPVALGLAMSVKQTPWLILLFLALALFLDAQLSGERRRGIDTAVGYVARAVAAFVVVNLPFIVLDPVAWARGALSPIISGLIPEGQGWIVLSTFMGVGGGTLLAYTALLACALICAVVLFVVAYPRTKLLVVLMPAFVLVFSSRSFASYLVMLALPAVVAACSVRVSWSEAPSVPAIFWGSVRRRAAVLGTIGLVAITLLLAVLLPPPLSLSITRVYGSGGRFAINRVGLRATNSSGQTVHPVFAARIAGQLTAPWLRISGPENLGPGQVGQYLVQAPNYQAQQSGGGGFRMVALTSSPAAMSVSAPYVPSVWRLTIRPYEVDAPIPLGVPVTLTVHVVDVVGRRVHRAGIPVSLRQSSYTSSGQRGSSSAKVNQRPIGTRAVTESTDANGVVRFVVVGTTSSLEPIYFQAYLTNRAFNTPYSTSDVVAIVFANTSSRP